LASATHAAQLACFQKEGEDMSRMGVHFRNNVVGYVALLISLTMGTAWAAATIGSAEVIDNSLRSVDLKNNAAVRSSDVVDEVLTAADLAPLSVARAEIDPEAFASGDIDPQSNGFGISPNAIQSSEIEDGQVAGSDVTNNNLTGDDILESSLGDVPGASTARNINGVNVFPIEFLAGPNSGMRTILPRTQGFEIRAQCTSSGDLETHIDTDRNARLLSWSFDAGADESDNEFAVENFMITTTGDLVNLDDGDQVGHTVYMTSGGGVVTVDWAADNNTSPAFGTQCAFVGTATSH
jgi:hypothetical protein